MNSEAKSNDKQYQTPLDTVASNMEIIDCSALKLWSQISAREYSSEKLNLIEKEIVYETSPFSVNRDINRKIALWVGDLTLLSIDAIVNTTNETFSERDSLCQRILFKGGYQLRSYMKNVIRSCRTGEAKLSKGFNLPARFIIHTVGPKYNQKYQTAAESALYSCYTRILQLMRENQLRTIGLCPVNTLRRHYPPIDGAHMALRVVRRYLENYAEFVELIVFVVENGDIGIYESLMPLYFPRSEAEENYARYFLPKDIGGELGEPVLPERQIRIADKPRIGFNCEDSVDLTSGMEASVIVGKSSFAKMQGDIDKRWGKQKALVRSIDNSNTAEEIKRRNQYERLLRKSKTEDLTEIASLRCLYVTGEDRFGRPVVVFIGQRFDFINVNKEKALLFLISTLDRIADKAYSVIYFHSLTTRDNHPSLTFIRNVYDILDYKYKKNLQALYIIHPSFWIRLVTWWFTTFTASSIKEKVYCLGGVEYLANILPLEQLQVPSFIMDYDFKVNGTRYTIEEGNVAD